MTEKTNKATLTTSIGTGGHNNKPLNQFEITTVTLSAVEWLQEQYNQCPKYEERIYEQDWEKAKEMEKEQIKKSFSDGAQWELYGSDLTYEERAEHYYNKTFKQQEQCKCGQPKVGGYSCQRTDCNQNL